MSQPFEKVAREFATRMRSKVHQQSFSHSVMSHASRRLSPTGKLAVERIGELTALHARHQRTLDPALRTSATQILRSLPLLSVEEDPHFIYALRALRAAAYFDAADLPVTHALINQHTRHAFMLDAVAMSSFVAVLARLRHPQTAEVMALLLPRLRALAAEFVPREVPPLLRLLPRGETAFVATIAQSLARTADAHPLADLTRAMSAIAAVAPDAAGRILTAAAPRLGAALLPARAAGRGRLLDVCRLVAATGGAPRGLMHAMARAALADAALPPPDAALVLRAFQLRSYRHMRLVRGLASAVASGAGDVSPPVAAAALQSLAHFYAADAAAVCVALVARAAPRIGGMDLALSLLACVRLQRAAPAVAPATDALCGAPLQRYTRRPDDAEVTCRLLYALAHAGRCRTPAETDALRTLLGAATRHHTPLQGDGRTFLLEAVETLEVNTECTDAEVRELLYTLREQLKKRS